MTQHEIIEMARQAGLAIWDESIQKNTFAYAMPELLEAFAKLVAAKEREACARVCEEHGKVWFERMLLGFQSTLNDVADAIRARGEA